MQVVGYETAPGGETDDACLLVAADGTLSVESLAAERALFFSLGERHCAGTVDDDRHISCGANTAPYCDKHTSRWACARCTGNCDRPLPTCREEHAVYLAAFAPATFKVGVTRSWRLETRLREQGADRAAHLRTVADGRIARKIEAEIAADVGDRVRVPTKIRGLDRSVDTAAWDSLLADYDHLGTFEFDYGYELGERPVAETMATGTVCGTKGRILLLATGGTTYAVDMRDLVGYELSAGGTDRDLQASLGAWH